MSLDFSKKIIRAVSFDRALFQKELHKVLKWLNSTEEVKMFQEWCIVEFGAKYPKIIQNTFSFSKKSFETELIQISKD